MKANELMIGDWVLCDINAQSDYEFDNVNYQPYQIENGEDIDYSIEKNMIGDADVYQPIPLTVEILENNDFRHRRSVEWGDFYTYTYTIKQNDKVLEYEQHFNLSPDPYEGNGFHWIPEMSAVSALRVVYVHELQQLLRLCKIEKEIIL